MCIRDRGISTLLNGTLVLRFGMRNLSFLALLVFTTLALGYSLIFWNTPNPSLWILLSFLSLLFLSLGFVWGNMRSIAMEPIGHIAGIGAAITGFISTTLSIPISIYVGSFITNSVWALFAGLGICGLLSVILFMIFKTRPLFASNRNYKSI